MRARRAPRTKTAPTPPPPFEREVWVADEEMRDEAVSATRRAASGADDVSPRDRRRRDTVAPEVDAELVAAAPPATLEKYRQRLAAAADALDRGRFGDARRMVQPVLRELPEIAFAHEIAGLALYRLGKWKEAANELEAARRLDGTVRHHPVLADCYRALRRYAKVDELWLELRHASPEPSVMAEGRIVAAGALADRGDLTGALAVMRPAMDSTGRRRAAREHHLRQWYVIADLLDRSGDVVSARRWFRVVVDHDPEFADAAERLRALGR